MLCQFLPPSKVSQSCMYVLPFLLLSSITVHPKRLNIAPCKHGFYILSEERTLGTSGLHFFKISKKKKKKKKKQNRPACTQRVSAPLAPGKGVLSSKTCQHWCPKKKGIQALFLTWTFFTSGQCVLFSNN